MAKSFVKPWTRLVSPGESVGPLIPTVDLLFITGDGSLRLESFLIDSGADISMAPRHLCKELELDWDTGEPINLNGISPKPECVVPARTLEVEFLVPEIGIALAIPICFADGDTSQVIGRAGFFDSFRITFDKQRLQTVFELNTEV